MKVVFVNINKKYLYIKEYEDKGELLRLLIKLNHTPTPPILPLLIDTIDRHSYSYYDYRIAYWYDKLASIVLPKFNEYIKYPKYKNKK